MRDPAAAVGTHSMWSMLSRHPGPLGSSLHHYFQQLLLQDSGTWESQ